MAQSNLFIRDGIYNPGARFEFKNTTTKDFTSAWNGSPIEVKAGETVIVPHYLAVKMTTELVDRIFQERAKADEDEQRPILRNPYWSSPIGIQAGVPAMRKPYEDEILKQVQDVARGIESQVQRVQLKDQLISDMERKPGVPEEAAPVKVEEFAQIKTDKVVEEPKAQIKLPKK